MSASVGGAPGLLMVSLVALEGEVELWSLVV